MVHVQGKQWRRWTTFFSGFLIAVSLWSCSNLGPQQIAHTSPLVPAKNNGVGRTPFMGWSTWNFIGRNPTEANVQAQAKVEASKLKAYGYNYILLDDFWYLNPSTTVDQYGRWVVDTSKFPDGLSGLASYVHSLGLKFGAYLTPGIPVAAVNQNTPIEGTGYHAKDIANTSQFEKNYNYGSSVMYYIDYSKPGAQAYINSWADELASWGVDFLKMDGVGDSDIPDVQAWSTALNQSGRSIYFDLSNNLDIKNASTWRANANAWRTQGDIECYSRCPGKLVSWGGVSGRFASAASWAQYAGPGGWNDLDAMDVADGTLDGLTNTQRQSYMTLWAMAAAPMYMGDDLTQMDSYGLSLLSNTEVIAVDHSGLAGTRVYNANNLQVWEKPNGDGSYSVALFNLGTSTAPVTVTWSELGFSGSAAARDLWAHNNLGSFSGSYTASVASDGSILLKVTPPITGTSYEARRGPKLRLFIEPGVDVRAEGRRLISR
jgi:alpha-galactosidase